jgi:hypothetical protein
MDEKNVITESQEQAAPAVEVVELTLDQLANVGGGSATPSFP